MFTFSCAPSGAGPVGARPSSRSSTAGAHAASTWRAPTRRSVPSVHTTSAGVDAPPGSIATTRADVLISAPAVRAAASSAPATAPMPPTGTSQSPVPPPITW